GAVKLSEEDHRALYDVGATLAVRISKVELTEVVGHPLAPRPGGGQKALRLFVAEAVPLSELLFAQEERLATADPLEGPWERVVQHRFFRLLAANVGGAPATGKLRDEVQPSDELTGALKARRVRVRERNRVIRQPLVPGGVEICRRHVVANEDHRLDRVGHRRDDSGRTPSAA